MSTITLTLFLGFQIVIFFCQTVVNQGSAVPQVGHPLIIPHSPVLNLLVGSHVKNLQNTKFMSNQ